MNITQERSGDKLMFNKIKITRMQNGNYLVEFDKEIPVIVEVDDDLLSPLVASLGFITAAILNAGGS
jgi:hypothetical protein